MKSITSRLVPFIFRCVSFPRIAFIGLLLCSGSPTALYSDDAGKYTTFIKTGNILDEDVKIKEFLISKDFYAVYLKKLEQDPEYQNASLKKRAALRKEAFLKHKYQRVRSMQLHKLVVTILKILGLPVGFVLIVYVLPRFITRLFNWYFGIRGGDKKWGDKLKTIERHSGIKSLISLPEKFIGSDFILQSLIKLPSSVMSQGILAEYILKDTYLGTTIKERTQCVKNIATDEDYELKWKEMDTFTMINQIIFSPQAMAGMTANKKKHREYHKDEIRQLTEAESKLINFEEISDEELAVKAYQQYVSEKIPGLLASIFFVAYSTLLLEAKESKVLLLLLYLNPTLTTMFVWLHFIYKKYRSNILVPITYLRTQKGIVVDTMEEAELLLIENWDRLSQQRKKVLQERLRDARKYIDKRSTIIEYVRNIVQLPTLSELTTPVLDSVSGDIDMSLFKYYAPPVQKKVYILFQRTLEGVQGYGHFYLVGAPGTGKTELVRRVGKELVRYGVNAEFVNLAGAKVSDIIGTPDKLGLIGEALIKASPYGKKQVLLCFDETDKALMGPHKHELIQLFLTMFDTNSTGYESPYLPGEAIPLPPVIVFMGNYEIKGPFADRQKRIAVDGYRCEILEKILREKLPEFCDKLKISIEKLGPKEHKAIDAFFIEKRKKIKNKNKKLSVRGIQREFVEELEILKYKNPSLRKKRSLRSRVALRNSRDRPR